MIIPKRWFLKLGLLMLVYLAAGFAVGAPQWRVLETPRFDVVSQISENETRAWAEEFNQFIESLKGVLTVDDRFLPRLTVVFFAREKDFDAYRPIGENGKVQDWVAGYFSRQETWSVIGMADRFEDESMRRIILHEGVHWFVSADQRRYPMWFNEGLAEVFSTFSLRYGKVEWGNAIDSRLISLHRQKLLPFNQLLFVSRTDKLFNESDRTGLFYSESWLFVHYLLFGQRKECRGSLNDFLTLYFSGQPTEEAFQKTFGLDFAAMEVALDEYLSGGKYRIYSFPVSPTAKITAPFEPASPAQVQVALAKLAYGSNHRDMAKKHAEDAVRHDPNYAAGYTMLAWGRRDEDSADDFFEAAQKAVQLGAQDPNALWLLAMARSKKAWALGGVPSPEARQIANLLEMAINLFPAQKSAYSNLASILPLIDQPNEQDVLFLRQGLKLFPDEPMILVGEARLLRKKGDKEEALKTLLAVSESSGLLSAKQKTFVQELRTSWDVTDTLERTNRLMKDKNYKEAVVLLDALLTRGPLVLMRNQIVQQRSRALASSTLQDAKKALTAGRLEEAARLYQSVVDMDCPPANTKAQARQALQKLKDRGSRAGFEAAAPVLLDDK